MKKIPFIFVLLFCLNSAFGQTKQPWLFRWQNKKSQKHLKKYVPFDTLVSTSGATLHISFDNKKNKPYLLLLHGMGANARVNWYKQIKPLSKNFNLILPDLIYFGESSSSSQIVSVEFQVQHIHEAISKLGITEKINIMGFSYGGLTAAVFNQLFHSKVNKLIIVDGPVKYYSNQMADSMAHSIGVENINRLIVPTTIQEFDCMRKAVMSSDIRLSKNMKQKILTYKFLPFKEIRDKQMSYLISHESTYQNYNYNLDKTETLLIWGEKDGVIPSSVGVKLNQAFPNTTKLIIYSDAKHDAHFSKSKQLNQDVLYFLK